LYTIPEKPGGVNAKPHKKALIKMGEYEKISWLVGESLSVDFPLWGGGNI